MRIKDPSKKKAIYQAALLLVLEYGFSGLKISKVAKKAGVAIGTVYIYFNNKEHLINELYLELKKRSTSSYLKGYSPELPFRKGFELIWQNYLLWTLERPEEVAFLEQYYRSPYLDAATINTSEALLQPIYLLLERGKAEGLVKQVATDLLAAQLSGSIYEIARWHHSGRFTLSETYIKEAQIMAWDSIKK